MRLRLLDYQCFLDACVVNVVAGDLVFIQVFPVVVVAVGTDVVVVAVGTDVVVAVSTDVIGVVSVAVVVNIVVAAGISEFIFASVKYGCEAGPLWLVAAWQTTHASARVINPFIRGCMCESESVCVCKRACEWTCVCF